MRLTRVLTLLSTVVVTIFFASQGMAAPTYSPSPDVLKARSILQEELQRYSSSTPVFQNDHGPTDSIDLTNPQDGQKYTTYLDSVIPSTITTSYVPGSAVMLPAWKIAWTDNVHMDHYYWLWSGWSQSDAQQIAWALKVLALDMRSYFQLYLDSQRQAHRIQCANWKTMPPMNDEERSHALLAQQAYQHGDLDAAGYQYSQVFRTYPCWPKGVFNTAMLLGATGSYDLAITDMNSYLDMVPDAPDAAFAQSKIAEWTVKMGY